MLVAACVLRPAVVQSVRGPHFHGVVVGVHIRVLFCDSYFVVRVATLKPLQLEVEVEAWVSLVRSLVSPVPESLAMKLNVFHCVRLA